MSNRVNISVGSNIISFDTNINSPMSISVNIDSQLKCSCGENVSKFYRYYDYKNISTLCYSCYMKYILDVFSGDFFNGTCLEDLRSRTYHTQLFEFYRYFTFHNNSNKMSEYKDIQKAISSTNDDISQRMNKIFPILQKIYEKVKILPVKEYINDTNKNTPEMIRLSEYFTNNLTMSAVPFDDYLIIIKKCGSCNKDNIYTYFLTGGLYYEYVCRQVHKESKGPEYFVSLCGKCNIERLIKKFREDGDVTKELRNTLKGYENTLNDTKSTDLIKEYTDQKIYPDIYAGMMEIKATDKKMEDAVESWNDSTWKKLKTFYHWDETHFKVVKVDTDKFIIKNKKYTFNVDEQLGHYLAQFDRDADNFVLCLEFCNPVENNISDKKCWLRYCNGNLNDVIEALSSIEFV